MRNIVLGVVGVLVLTGCGSAAAAPASSSAQSRTVQVAATFTTSPGTATTYDPQLVPPGARVSVSSESDGESTTVTLAVRGLEPDRSYGAHAHTQPCGATGDAAGPHFQHVPDPVQPSVDPAYANPQNEVWLDLTTDGEGAGSATTTVPWGSERARRAQSVVIHATPTATGAGRAGTAGDRAACVTVAF
jgi:Cu-Zn family superoxide dismutase